MMSDDDYLRTHQTVYDSELRERLAAMQSALHRIEAALQQLRDEIVAVQRAAEQEAVSIAIQQKIEPREH